MVDPPGAEPDRRRARHLMPVDDDGHIVLRTYSPLGEPARVLPGILFFHGGGWVAGAWKPMTASAAGWPTKPAAG